MKKIMIFSVFILCGLTLFGGETYETKYSSEGYYLQTDYGELRIDDDGKVLFKDQQYDLFDSQNMELYEAGVYLGAVFEKHFFAYIMVQLYEGIRDYLLIVNHVSGDVVYFGDTNTGIGGLKYLVSLGDNILLFNGISLSCFSTITETIIWRYDWSNNYTNNYRLRSYEIDGDTISVDLALGPTLVFNINDGLIE